MNILPLTNHARDGRVQTEVYVDFRSSIYFWVKWLVAICYFQLHFCESYIIFAKFVQVFNIFSLTLPIKTFLYDKTEFTRKHPQAGGLKLNAGCWKDTPKFYIWGIINSRYDKKTHSSQNLWIKTLKQLLPQINCKVKNAGISMPTPLAGSLISKETLETRSLF